MVWSDDPTEPQINAVYRWLSWNMPTQEAREAANWLRDNSTRREVSTEMSRLKKLYDRRLLNKETAFESDIWEEYREQQ